MAKKRSKPVVNHSRRVALGSQAKKKTWTVAIYMTADGSSGSNDLDQVAIRELGDIVLAASTAPNGNKTGAPIDHINVAVQLDLSGVNGMLQMTVENDGNVGAASLRRRTLPATTRSRIFLNGFRTSVRRSTTSFSSGATVLDQSSWLVTSK